MTVEDLVTPALLVDADRLERNLASMQVACSETGVELWPHAKTHKSVAIARRQLALGAAGLTCAKIGEAEALLPSGVRRIFLAHCLVDPRLAPRLRRLRARLDQLVLAATSEPQFAALRAVLEAAEIHADILIGVDTGLGREGVRTTAAAHRLASAVRMEPRTSLLGLYTHEGHAYRAAPDSIEALAQTAHARLREIAGAIGGEITLWPGCTITARTMLTLPGIHAIRPGAYVFGDLYLADMARCMGWGNLALTVLATVVDRPAPDLALVDAGSKTLSGDKTSEGISARVATSRDLAIEAVSEEHGFLRGPGVDRLRVGDRLPLVPAHACPVVNLADYLFHGSPGEKLERWPVDARG